jgi:DNA-directed RNA polymerase specialized sigma24 family protein
MPPSPEYDRFLELLGSDRMAAASAYARLRARMLFYFRQNGSRDAGDAADEVICRVVRRVREGVEIRPSLNSFCYGVASKVLMEERGKIGRRHPSLEETGEPAPHMRSGLTPLETSIYVNEGLESLSAEDRAIWLEYHQGDRNGLAENLNITLNALRIKISRIKVQLRGKMSDDPVDKI